MSTDLIKHAIGKKAAELVETGMIVGLGTGSTSSCFIESLILRCQQGLKIKAVASSKHSEQQARQGGIPLIDINTITSIDLYIDGTDAIDPEKRMIKGGGGALTREKITASMSSEMVVIFDESKLVNHLGKHPLPVEVIPFGIQATHHKIKQLGMSAKWRLAKDKSLYVTDNGNYILDLSLNTQDPPEEIHEKLIHIPGVVETGFFFGLAGRQVIGFRDGQVIIKD